MHENLNIYVLAGTLIGFYGVASYIKDTLLGSTKPNRITWLIWAIAPIIGSAASLSDGVTWAALPVFMAGFGPLLVFIASFVNKNAYWKLARLDYVCGAFSILALVLWAITKEPTVAVMLTIISDLLAGLPTLVKLWKFPETESVAPFVTGLIAALTSFTAITTWTLTSYAFPAYLSIISLFLIGAFYRKKIVRLFK